MRYPFSAWASERAWQTCPIALAAAVGWKKRLSTPSTTPLLLRASSPVLGSRRGVDGSHRTQTARPARRWLRRRQRSSSVSGWEASGVYHNPSCSSNGDLDDAKQGIVWRCKLFLSWSGFVFSASAEGQNQMQEKTLGSHNIQQKVGECSEPGRKKEGNVGVILPSSAGPWRLRYGSFG